VVLVVWEN